jgi:hypothetical protein
MGCWLVVLSAAFFAGAASPQVAAGRQAEKLPSSSNAWAFFLGGYGYLRAGEPAYGYTTYTFITGSGGPSVVLALSYTF